MLFEMLLQMQQKKNHNSKCVCSGTSPPKKVKTSQHQQTTKKIAINTNQSVKYAI
jgi:hypothetical protein